MRGFVTCVGVLIVTGAAFGQTSDDRRRAALRAKYERIFAIEERMRQIQPRRRDTPVRAENIRDGEVREIQLVTSPVLPGAIINISTVVVGCPCEDGATCTDQVWVLAHRPDKTLGLLLSKINNRWTVGPVQRWWLEYEKLQARSGTLEEEDAG
jgi:hypothetical protein